MAYAVVFLCLGTMRKNADYERVRAPTFWQ